MLSGRSRTPGHVHGGKDPGFPLDRRYALSQAIVWVSNDTLSGFTINGRGRRSASLALVTTIRYDD